MTSSSTRPIRAALALALVSLILVPAEARAAGSFSPWEPAEKIDEIAGNSAELNTPFLDGCPIQSPDGQSLYLASNRPRFAGDTRTDLDIWVAHRRGHDGPFGSPENLGAPVNSTADDFCPTPVHGHGLFFVSRRVTADSCGLGDVYRTRSDRKHGWADPEHLACAPVGPNSALDEQGPSLVSEGPTAQLFFSRSTPTTPGDIYRSTQLNDGAFGPAEPVVELNDAVSNDIQPNVRHDGREVVFSSNRSGTLGGQDVWSARRASLDDPWSAPINVGAGVNTAAAETRPSLSWDARTLLFGRAPGPEGMSDVYLSGRAASHGGHG